MKNMDCRQTGKADDGNGSVCLKCSCETAHYAGNLKIYKLEASSYKERSGG